MSGEIEIGDGSGARKTIDPRLPRDLCPSIGCAPPISGPLLNRLWGGLYFDYDSLLQIRDECRCFVDKVLGKFVFNFPIPIRIEVIGGFTAQAECAFPLGCMGWIDFRWSEEVEGSLL